jgi:drug/metabolite transporter (DMT)-like permease
MATTGRPSGCRAAPDPFPLATPRRYVYNRAGRVVGHETHLPQLPSNASRRWTVIAAGFLIFAIALVVIYAGAAAFHSPLAAVVLAAIGLAAVLFQLRLRQDPPRPVRVPQWLNLIGIVCAGCALFADRLRLGAGLYEVAAFGAVGCFGISSLIMLDGMRRNRVAPK